MQKTAMSVSFCDSSTICVSSALFHVERGIDPITNTVRHLVLEKRNYVLYYILCNGVYIFHKHFWVSIYQHIIFWLLKFSVTVCHQPRKKICMYYMMYLYIYKHFRPLWEILKVSSSLDIIFDLHFWMVLIKPFSSLCGGNLQKL